MIKIHKVEDLPEREFDEIIDSIIQGHVLQALDAFPSNSVDLVVTSPPYYGKRFYNTQPQIWGEDKLCNHKWKWDIRKVRHGKSEWSTIRHKGADKHTEQVQEVKYATCEHCKAWLGELGQEPKYEMFIENLFQIFMEIGRILKPKGQLWINLGDTYYGSGGWGKHKLTGKGDTLTKRSKQTRFQTILSGKDYKHKCLMLIPTRLAEKLIDDGGFYLRNLNIWHSTNRMPESCKDRFTNRYEFFMFFTKQKKYYSNLDSVKVPSKTYPIDKRSQKGKRIQYEGKSQKTSEWMPSPELVNCGDVWTFPSASYGDQHFATYPEALIERPIKFGCPKNGIVLDPFLGSGTTAIVAKKHGRRFIGIELNSEYVEQARARFQLKENLQFMHGKNIKKLFQRPIKENWENESEDGVYGIE